MLKPADEPVNLVNYAKLVVAGADYFRDACLQHQLTVEVNAEIKNRLHKTDHLWCQYPVSDQHQLVSLAFGAEPNHISSVLAALTCSLCDVHHKVMLVSNYVTDIQVLDAHY